MRGATEGQSLTGISILCLLFLLKQSDKFKTKIVVIGFALISPDPIHWKNGAISIARWIVLLKVGHHGIQHVLVMTQVLMTNTTFLFLLLIILQLPCFGFKGVSRRAYTAMNPSPTGRQCPMTIEQWKPCPAVPCYTWSLGSWSACQLHVSYIINMSIFFKIYTLGNDRKNISIYRYPPFSIQFYRNLINKSLSI